MKKQARLPVEGKVIRFAPGRNEQPAASFWKVWSEGSEVYASSRAPRGSAKISVHASGQVHYRLEAKLKQDLAPVMRMGSGPWFHAFELRFLLSSGAYSPQGQRKSLKNKKSYLIPVPDGFVLHANLIIGSTGTHLDAPLPAELLPAGQALWRSRLRDRRPAVLVARMLQLDDANRESIRYVREELKPTVTFSSMPDRRYVEIYHLHWSPEGGNVILVVPMGEEAFRSEQDLLESNGRSSSSRHFRYRSSRATVGLTAPNGLKVADIELAEVDKEVELVKGVPKTVELGPVTMRIEPSNLIAGSKFIASPVRLVCIPSIDGASPHNWGYMIHARFDGSRFIAELRRNSASLQNRNLATPISQLGDDEELVIAIPAEAAELSSTLELPSTSISLLGRFTLRGPSLAHVLRLPIHRSL
jgi:hypothetical protein